MALVNICDVTVLNNPTKFLEKFQFEITFECLEDLPQGMLYILRRLRRFIFSKAMGMTFLVHRHMILKNWWGFFSLFIIFIILLKTDNFFQKEKKIFIFCLGGLDPVTSKGWRVLHFRVRGGEGR